MPQLVYEALDALWWLVPVAVVLLIVQSPWLKGILGEAFVRFAARLRLPATTYRRLHNVTLPTPDGSTQIDHVFVSRFGIFVVETKNMKGWIFGGENQPQWTQKIYKKSFKFQNPLRQNYKHVKALEALLNVPPDTIHSVVVFAGASKFKSKMPPNVTQAGGFVAYIRSYRKPVFSESDISALATRIQASRLEQSRETNRQHVQGLKTRANPEAERKCPRCGSSMVLRTARRGANTGNQFWGCSAYPRCKMMHNAT